MSPPWLNGTDGSEFFGAARTLASWFSVFLRLRRVPVADEQRPAGGEGDFFAFAFCGGVAPSVVADCAEAFGQDVAQKPSHKLFSGQFLESFPSCVAPVLPAEGHALFVAMNETAIVDGTAADVLAEVFDGSGPTPAGLDMNGGPFLVAPHRWINFIDAGGEGLFHRGAERSGNDRYWYEESRTFGEDHFALSIKPGPGH